MQAGVLGYILKEAADTELVKAVRLAAQGRTYLQPDLGAPLAAEPPDAPDDLSDRELEILRFIALGHTNGEIAESFEISVRTVESPPRSHIQQKLHLAKRSELVRYALERGMLDAEQGVTRELTGPRLTPAHPAKGSDPGSDPQGGRAFRRGRPGEPSRFRSSARASRSDSRKGPSSTGFPLTRCTSLPRGGVCRTPPRDALITVPALKEVARALMTPIELLCIRPVEGSECPRRGWPPGIFDQQMNGDPVMRQYARQIQSNLDETWF